MLGQPPVIKAGKEPFKCKRGPKILIKFEPHLRCNFFKIRAHFFTNINRQRRIHIFSVHLAVGRSKSPKESLVLTLL
jgi:hypothetical protein